MLYPIENVENLKDLNESVSLEYQEKIVGMQEKLGKQNFQEDMTKVFEPVTKSFEKTSQSLTKAITGSSFENNKALENLNNKRLEIMNDRGVFDVSSIRNNQS